MTNPVSTIIPNMRAAARQRLLAISLPAVTVAGTATIADGVLTAAGEDFGAEGFVPGYFVKLAGFSAANNGVHRIVGVNGDTMTFADKDALADDSAVAPLISVPLPDVAWENEAYTPEAGVPYIQEVFRRGGGQPVLFGGMWRHDLLLSLTLQWPSGQGTLGLESMAGRLLELYRPGTPLAYGGQAGQVASADQAQSVTGPVFSACAVTAKVKAWTAN